MKQILIFVLTITAASSFAAEKSSQLHPAFIKLEKKLHKYLADFEPRPEFKYRNEFNTLEVSYEIQKYQIHNRSKSGQIYENTHEEAGPSHNGFVLVCHIQPAGSPNQLGTPQTITRPYWKTDFDVTKIAGTDKQIYWGLSYGSRTDIKTKLLIKQTMINLSKHETPERRSSLIWQDKKSGEVIFSADDIIKFDWEKQQILLTLDGALDFSEYCNPQSGQFREFLIKDGSEKIMEARWVSPLSSMSFPGPVYRPEAFFCSRLIEIGACYAGPCEDKRFNEKLRMALKREGVLGNINEADPAKFEIETIRYPHPWQKIKNGISARVELYPQTFRENANARAHIFFFVQDSADISEINNISIWLQIISENKFSGITREYLVSPDYLHKGVYAFEFNPFAFFGDCSPDKEHFGRGKAKLTIEFQNNYNTIDKITFPEIEIPVTSKK